MGRSVQIFGCPVKQYHSDEHGAGPMSAHLPASARAGRRGGLLQSLLDLAAGHGSQAPCEESPVRPAAPDDASLAVETCTVLSDLLRGATRVTSSRRSFAPKLLSWIVNVFVYILLVISPLRNSAPMHCCIMNV